MREIKFRAMIDHKWPCYVYPFGTKHKTRVNKSVIWVELFGMGRGNGPSWWCEPNGYGSCTRFNGEILRGTVVQYTGLTDKNGVEIYEGDRARHEITRTPASFFEDKTVVFDQGMFLLGESPLGWIHTDCIEVIGNIYETPDLLEGK